MLEMERNVRLAVLVLLAALAVAAIAIASSERADALTYDVKLTFKDDTPIRTAQGLNPITFNYTIKHTGEYLSEEVIIELQNEPIYWQHYLSASTKAGVRSSTNFLEILMQKNEISNVSLTITPPQNQLNQTFWMTVNAYPKKDPAINRSHNIGGGCSGRPPIPGGGAGESLLHHPDPRSPGPLGWGRVSGPSNASGADTGSREGGPAPRGPEQAGEGHARGSRQRNDGPARRSASRRPWQGQRHEGRRPHFSGRRAATEFHAYTRARAP